MKKINRLLLLFTALLLVISCQNDNSVFGDINAPSGLEVTKIIQGVTAETPDGDGSGIVNFKATAKNAISYKYIFSDGTSSVAPSGELKKAFNQVGINTYSVTVLANGKAGITSSITFEVTVFSNFSDPVTLEKLTGGTSKKWYWAASELGHLGVGQNDGDVTKNFYANYYQAGAFEKAASPSSSCLYDNELTFSIEAGILKFQLDNKGHTFFNKDFKSVVNGAALDDNCYDFDSTGKKTVLLSAADSFVPKTESVGTQMTFSDNGFMGYYIGQSTYEILSITENRMTVRAVMGGNPALAWYHTFSTSPPIPAGNDDYTNLVWSDEFEVDGAPNPAKWTYNTGGTGWGNNEAQNYTSNPTNVKVANGILKITAIKETSGASNYSSARIVTDNLYSFKYGKVEIRAKLPSGAGTWPAIWMLGQNYPTNIWPACGEIDIMEHVGIDQNTIHGSLHYPGHSGGNPSTGTTFNSTVTSEFHNYSVVWGPTSIKFYVDNIVYHSFANNVSTPFNANFFLILNLAMGGNFGGAIDPNFTQATMEVEYVRVYQ